MDNPFFTVIIPTFNRADTLPMAIQSVLDQTFDDLEIVICDDGSTDHTRDVVAAYGDTRVRYHYQQNAGVTQARNAGSELAKGSVLVFLDSDDRITPRYLEKLDSAFHSGPVRLAFGFAKYVDGGGRLLRELAPRKENGFFAPQLTGAYAIEKKLYQSLGGYDGKLAYSENTDFFLRMRYLRIVNDDEVFLVPDEGVLITSRDARERFNSYSTSRYRSIGYFLDKHREYFKQSPGAFVDYKTVFAVAAFQHGDYVVAMHAMSEVIKKNPTRWKAYFQYALMAVPMVGRLYWKAPTKN